MAVTHPLTAFEEYMLHDDCVEQPMTFFLRADLEGQLRESRLRSAFDEVVRRHPIFWSRVVKQGRAGLAWEPDPTRIPTLSVRARQPFGSCPLNSYIDLDTQSGIRGLVSVDENSAELWLQFHHSCCDGIAGVAFLQELIEAYGRTSHPTSSPATEADFPEYCCAYSRLTSREKAQRFARDLPRIWKFFFRRVMSLPASVMESPPARGCPSYVEARMPFTASMRARLKRAHGTPTSVNDILLRDVYLALKDATAHTARPAKDEWLRIAVPTNHRNANVPVRGCRNDMGMAFLDLRMGDSPSKAESLRNISDEMTLIKQHRMGNSMLGALNYMRYAPGAMARVVAMQDRSTTVVVSNLGKVLTSPKQLGPIVTGDVTVKQLGFLVPIREGTPISFGALTYADQLTICMHYDARVMDRAHASQLLSRVVAYLRDSLAPESHEAA